MRRFFKMPPQVFRIFLLAVGIVVVYSVARYFLTPPSFGQYGWYRGEALAELATRDRCIAGKKACEECHSDEYQKLAKARAQDALPARLPWPGRGARRESRMYNIDRKLEFGQPAFGATRPIPRGPSGTSRSSARTITPAPSAPNATCPTPHRRSHEEQRFPTQRAGQLGAAVAGLLAAPAAKAAKAAVQKVLVSCRRAQGLRSHQAQVGHGH